MDPADGYVKYDKNLRMPIENTEIKDNRLNLTNNFFTKTISSTT